MMESIVTETASAVSVSSAEIRVLCRRVSTTAYTTSKAGIRKYSPGPRTPANRPSRSTTARSHSAAVRKVSARIIPISTTMPPITGRPRK